MAKFIEFHFAKIGKLLVNSEQIRSVQTVEENLGGCKVVLGDLPGSTAFYAKESYEEVKKLLLGAEPQRVPWEAD
jgi:hypothetical protein|nr:MAG TPA_asm: hypothetical protein [Caudoviricetes sp.]